MSRSQIWDGSAWVSMTGGGDASPQFIVFATGDVEAEVKTGTARLKMPFAVTVISLTPTAGVAPTGADLIADMHLNGTTIFTTQGNRPTIAAGAQDGSKTTPDVTAIASGDVITMDIDQVGSTLPGENVVIILEITVP